MYCFRCGAVNSDQARFCLKCGKSFEAIRNVQAGEGNASNQVYAEPVTQSVFPASEEPRIPSKLKDNAGDIAKQLNILFWVLIVQNVGEVLLVVLGYCTESRMVSHIYSVFTLCMMAAMLAALKQLGSLEKQLDLALKLYFGQLLAAIVAVAFPEVKSVIYILNILYYYNLFHGMEKLCVPFPKISERWGLLFKQMVLYILLAIIAIVVFSCCAVGIDLSDESLAKALILLAIILIIIPATLYAVYLYKSRNAFLGLAEETAEPSKPDEGAWHFR